jgi:hypothetical protein
MITLGPYLSKNRWMRFVFSDEGTLDAIEEFRHGDLQNNMWEPVEYQEQQTWMLYDPSPESTLQNFAVMVDEGQVLKLRFRVIGDQYLVMNNKEFLFNSIKENGRVVVPKDLVYWSPKPELLSRYAHEYEQLCYREENCRNLNLDMYDHDTRLTPSQQAKVKHILSYPWSELKKSAHTIDQYCNALFLVARGSVDENEMAMLQFSGELKHNTILLRTYLLPSTIDEDCAKSDFYSDGDNNITLRDVHNYIFSLLHKEVMTYNQYIEMPEAGSSNYPQAKIGALEEYKRNLDNPGRSWHLFRTPVSRRENLDNVYAQYNDLIGAKNWPELQRRLEQDVNDFEQIFVMPPSLEFLKAVSLLPNLKSSVSNALWEVMGGLYSPRQFFEYKLICYHAHKHHLVTMLFSQNFQQKFQNPDNPSLTAPNFLGVMKLDAETINLLFSFENEQDLPVYMHTFALFYLVDQEMPIEAVEQLEKAANAKYEVAQATLGLMYLYGIAVEKDHDMANYWLSLAQENHSEIAENILSGNHFLPRSGR